jgi:hypothetical protein
LLQSCGLLGAFHAFRDRLHTQDLGEVDHRGDDPFVFGVLFEPLDERAVDLKKSSGRRLR